VPGVTRRVAGTTARQLLASSETTAVMTGTSAIPIPDGLTARRRTAISERTATSRNCDRTNTSVPQTLSSCQQECPTYDLCEPAGRREERLATGAARRMLAVAFRTTRRASLTAWEVGNAFATSGCSATSVVPWSCFAYFPRTPDPRAARSYSGRFRQFWRQR
jgi:hypothetical protein